MTVEMAIQFARMEYVSRGGNGNICLKAAYNKRDQIENNRTGAKYSFETRGGNVHHAILLPEGASDKFLESSVLWNEVELFENRKNSRLAKEIVLALPDDKEISLEDRIELSRRFASENFTSKGLAVQIDIHEPHHDEDKNWHAHLLITTRRFSEDGQTFDVKKARDLDGIIRKGMVLEIDRWGEIWKQVQNSYFEEKGYALRVDEIGVVAQEHLGPVRMRHHMSEVIARGDLLKVANTEESLDAGKILKHLTEKLSVFSDSHIEGYLNKHVRVDLREKILGKILGHGELVHLHDKETGELTGFYTTKSVRDEEEKILRIAERVEAGKGIELGKSPPKDYSFSDEQKRAFEYCLESGHGIRVVQGRAGTGKSYLMQGVKDACTAAGISVIGLAPTRTVVADMVDSGFEEARTIHEFLFRYKNGRVSVNQKSILMVDEAGMVGTRAFGELLKVAQVHGSKVILVGDDRQLPSVERGGLFKVLSEKFGSVELKEVRRQEVQWQRQVSEDLSQGKIREAVNLLEEKGALHWHEDKAGSLSALVEDYSRSYMADSSKTRLILSHRNIEVDVLNQAIRQVRQAVGQVSTTEYVCSTLRGDVPFATGDRVQFMRTDKKLGLSNGEFGVLVEASKDKFKIQKDTGHQVSFDPSQYEGLRLGYASTIYKGQGKTVEEAYVLHSPLMTQNLSYVALTRQVKEVHLYVSKDEAKVQEDLVAQMSKSDARVVSLGFLTAQQLEKEQKIQESFVHKMAYGVGDSVRGVLQRFTDHLPNQSFYQVSALPEFKGHRVREQNALEKWEQTGADTQKRQDLILEKEVLNKNRSSERVLKETYDLDRIHEDLKKDVRGFSTHLLGAPDLKLSTKQELCFRKDGKVFVNLQSGLWKDFVNDTGGNLFDLIQRERGGTFKDSLVYAANYFGYGPEKTPPAGKVFQKPVEQEVSQEAGEEARQKATVFYQKTVDISATLGERYFREHRGIRGDIPGDIRFAPKVYNREVKGDLPAVVSFVRDKQGNLTGYQTIYLDAEKGSKAELGVAKRTQGALSKSFVEIQKWEGCSYLVEGMETALSLKEAGVQGTILASLGIHNLKNYEGSIKHVILCADNDGPEAPTNKVIEKTKAHLVEKGYSVKVVRPTEIGKDFNDILVSTGKEGVRAYFKDANFVKSQSSPTRVDAQEEKSLNTSTKISSQKTPKTPDRQVEARSLFSYMQESYKRELTEMYQARVGDKHALYEKQIDQVATRVAENALIRNIPEDPGLRKVNLSQANYELQRLPEIQEALVEQDPKFFFNWMEHHLKAEVLTAIEGRFYGILRCQKPLLDKQDKKLVQEEAPKHLKEHNAKVKKYSREAMKDYDFSKTQAQMFAQQKALFEERFRIKPNEIQEQTLKNAAEYGHSQYEKHKNHIETQQTNKHGQLSEKALTYIDQAAFYRAHLETKEVLMQELSKSGSIFKDEKQLAKIETKAEKEFRDDKDHYKEVDKKQQQQQKEIEQKQIQTQQRADRDRDMSL